MKKTHVRRAKVTTKENVAVVTKCCGALFYVGQFNDVYCMACYRPVEGVKGTRK